MVVFAGAFAIMSYAVAFFLLATVPLRGPLRVRALVWVRWPRYRQAAAMPQSAVGPHFDVTLDVQRDFLAEIALDRALVFEDLTDVVDFVLGHVADLLVGIDAGPVEQAIFARVRPIP